MQANLNALDMRLHYNLNLAAPRVRVLPGYVLPLVFAGLSHTLSAADASPPPPHPYQVLESARITPLAVRSYERSPRDHFVDASVKLNLVSQENTAETTSADPLSQAQILESFSQELHSQLLQSYRISGLVSAEKDGSVLIGRRILRVGDKLDLVLGDEVVKKLQTLDQTYHLRLGEILGLGILPLEIISITPTGIELYNRLFPDAFKLPFFKAAQTAPAAPAPSIPR